MTMLLHCTRRRLQYRKILYSQSVQSVARSASICDHCRCCCSSYCCFCSCLLLRCNGGLRRGTKCRHCAAIQVRAMRPTHDISASLSAEPRQTKIQASWLNSAEYHISSQHLTDRSFILNPVEEAMHLEILSHFC